MAMIRGQCCKNCSLNATPDIELMCCCRTNKCLQLCRSGKCSHLQLAQSIAHNSVGYILPDHVVLHCECYNGFVQSASGCMCNFFLRVVVLGLLSINVHHCQTVVHTVVTQHNVRTAEFLTKM